MSKNFLYFQSNSLKQSDLTDEAVCMVRFAVDENDLLAAKKVLESNKFLKKVSIDTAYFEVDETYEGKARDSQVVLYKHGGLELEFSNDYTDTVYTKSFLVSDGFRAGADYQYPDVFIYKDDDDLFISLVGLNLEQSEKTNNALSTSDCQLLCDSLLSISNLNNSKLVKISSFKEIYFLFDGIPYELVTYNEFLTHLKKKQVSFYPEAVDQEVLTEQRNIVLAEELGIAEASI